MKKLILMLAVVVAVTCASSCAESKTFKTADGKEVEVEPYGWFSTDDKIDSVEYQLCIPNLVLDVVFCETIVVPVILTGAQLYEPVKLKTSK